LENVEMANATEYQFSFGPWNISEGADPFGPEVRKPYSLEEKLDWYPKLGFQSVQFHDDDVVENLEDLSPQQALKRAGEIGAALSQRSLVAEFVAPRLWFDARTVDGGLTSNCTSDRQYALDRCLRSIDIASAVDSLKPATTKRAMRTRFAI